MRTNLNKLFLLLLFSLIALSGWALVSDYAFTSATGTYTEISGGTVLGDIPNLDNESFNAIPLGFSFNFNGINYTEISVNANGFLAMGPTVASSYLAISSATGTNSVVAAMNRDIIGRDNGELMYLLSGTAPNRVFTVQWKNYKRVPTTAANDVFNFQIQLYEGTNVVKTVYGAYTAVTVSTAQTVQIGLRGDANTDYNNRTTTEDWTATTAGTANNSSVRISAICYPPNGLTFTWTPSQIGNPPLPAQNPVPANSAINVHIAANLAWASGGGTPTGYKVYLGTDNPPTNIANGTLQAETSYDPAANFNYNTLYYWQIVPYNDFGDAVDCPVWQFTTMADPTITTFPYSQNFDAVTVPALPVGWVTVNANDDSYTWESVASNANSAPNAVRIRYNTATAMDDWLISPPLQLTANVQHRVAFYYRAGGATYPEKLALYIGNAPTATALSTQLYSNTSIVNTVYEMAEIYFTPTTAGVYYLGFHGYSDADMFYLYMDDFVVERLDNTVATPTFNPPAGSYQEQQDVVISTTTADAQIRYTTDGTDPNATSTLYTAPVALNVTTTLKARGYRTGYAPSAIATAVYEITEPMDPPNNLQATVQGQNVHLTWEAPGELPPPPLFSDDFESYADFSLVFDPWTLVDVDLSATYGMTGYTWTNAYSPMAYIIFNPSATSPAVTDLPAHGGAKFAASFASTSAVNNDWMISPSIQAVNGTTLSFWARSYVSTYGLERFKVGVSTTGTAPADFTIISGASYVQAPITWTNYIYDLSAYAGQSIRFGIQCLSDDAFIFCVDDVEIMLPVGKMEVPMVSNDTPLIEGRGTREIGFPTAPVYFEQPITRVQTGYKVYRGGTLIETITNPANLEYTDTGLEPGTYSYTVTATYTLGESIPAGPVNATVNPYLEPPTDLAAVVEGNDVTLTWENPSGPITGEWISWSDETLGNSVGTNSASNFDVAHRFTATDLAAHVGAQITQVKVVPCYLDCVYTLKIWTGGTAGNPGTLVHTQPINNPVLNDWNLIVLLTPVNIVAGQEIWVGYNVNTQGGYPAGCDAGPAIDGFGNCMYFQNAWTTLLALAPTLNYNWSIQTFAQTDGTLKAITNQPIVENRIPVTNEGSLALNRYEAPVRDRNTMGYKVYKDGVLITTISDPAITTYSVMDLPNGTYTFGVSALYATGESDPATVDATIDVYIAEAFWTDGFESYEDFSLEFAPWTLNDVEGSATYGFDGTTFPNAESAMAFIVFNPSQTTPPITSLTPHGGNKMVAAFADIDAANNDWLISPRVHLGTESALRFYAKSHTATYGLEKMRVGVSALANPIPASFQYLTGPTPVEVPVNWTEYIYDLSNYNGQSVWIAIRCVSTDAFVFYVDDFSVHGVGGYMANEDPLVPSITTTLKGNYPNPFNPETTISYSVKEATPVSIEIYNLKGQRVKTLVNDTKAAGDHSVVWNGKDNNNQNVTSGVYFYKMNAGKFSSTKKMILMK